MNRIMMIGLMAIGSLAAAGLIGVSGWLNWTLGVVTIGTALAGGMAVGMDVIKSAIPVALRVGRMADLEMPRAGLWLTYALLTCISWTAAYQWVVGGRLEQQEQRREQRSEVDDIDAEKARIDKELARLGLARRVSEVEGDQKRNRCAEGNRDSKVRACRNLAGELGKAQARDQLLADREKLRVEKKGERKIGSLDAFAESIVLATGWSRERTMATLGIIIATGIELAILYVPAPFIAGLIVLIAMPPGQLSATGRTVRPDGEPIDEKPAPVLPLPEAREAKAIEADAVVVNDGGGVVVPLFDGGRGAAAALIEDARPPINEVLPVGEVGRYVVERLAQQPGNQLDGQQLYADYRGWCERERAEALNWLDFVGLLSLLAADRFGPAAMSRDLSRAVHGEHFELRGVAFVDGRGLKPARVTA
jgi:hypothetical protein